MTEFEQPDTQQKIAEMATTIDKLLDRAYQMEDEFSTDYFSFVRQGLQMARDALESQFEENKREG